MSDSKADDAPEPAAPDWAAHVGDIACPLCDYNLRGLSDPRCPECGQRFQWAELLDPSRRPHPYLFEFHPKHNFTSFWKTAVQGLWPTKFWRTIREDQRCVPRRLALYWIIVAAFVVLAFASDYFLLELQRYIYFPGSWSLPDFRWQLWAVVALALILSWPWLTFLCLWILQAPMRELKAKHSHVMRCTVYAWDVCLWVALFCLLVNAIRAVQVVLTPANPRAMYYTTPYPAPIMRSWIWIPAELAFIHRLLVACLRSLRFRHVVATVLVSQVMAMLIDMAIAAIIYGLTLK